MTTIEALEKRIKRLEERVFVQDKAIKSTLDLVQQAIDAQFRRWKENEELFKKESAERLNRIMKELGYETG